MKPPPKFLRIYLVEESTPDMRLIAEMLREYGQGQLILCGVFQSLHEAIQELEASGGVDVLLLALSLPDSQGISTLVRLLEAVPNQTVVALGGYEDENLSIEAIGHGAQEFVLKQDLRGKALVRSIHCALERKRAEVASKATHEDLERQIEDRTKELRAANNHLSSALEQLKATQDVALRQERLHAMERMAGGIAHDFNNALSPILAHSEWLLRKPEAVSDEIGVKKALASIHESAKHCAEMVFRLREFCRERDNQGTFEELDLASVVQEAICLTQPSWENQVQMRGCNISIQTHFASVPKIHGSKEELVELFANLILNATDAIAENGVISLSIFKENGRVVASIADNGMGMSEETQARCLEPFFTTKPDKGAGLGLGIAYGIAQRHHAAIDIQSAEGKGTTVSVRLPTREPDASTQQKADSEHAKPLKGLRILVVEDEPNIREILGIYLTEDGHQVEMAKEGEEALQKFAKSRFDLLLTDYSMPNMNGDYLAAAIRAEDPGIRIALLTGFGSQLPQGALLRLEMDAIIAKPFTFESLRQGIIEAMGH